jgi:hypothetical protein
VGSTTTWRGGCRSSPRRTCCLGQERTHPGAGSPRLVERGGSRCPETAERNRPDKADGRTPSTPRPSSEPRACRRRRGTRCLGRTGRIRTGRMNASRRSRTICGDELLAVINNSYIQTASSLVVATSPAHFPAGSTSRRGFIYCPDSSHRNRVRSIGATSAGTSAIHLASLSIQLL